MPASGTSNRAVYESMPRGELIAELCKRDQTAPPEPSRLLHELQVHQVELEAQNRELAETQRELQESRARYADLFDLAPVAYCLFDRNGVIRDVNVAAATLLRTSRAALIGAPFTRVVQADEKQMFLDHIARCLDEEMRVSSEMIVRARGRGEIIVQMVSTPVVGRAARIETCRTMLNDVTRLKRSEQAFRFLADLNESLIVAFDTPARLSSVGDVCVPALADVCFVDLSVGDAANMFVRAAPYERQDFAEPLQRTAADPAWRKYRAHLLETLTPVFEPTSASALGMVDASALLVLPLVSRRRTLGLLGMVMASSKRSYSLQDFELGQAFARRSALALDNSLVYDKAREDVSARDAVLQAVLRDLQGDEPAAGVTEAARRIEGVLQT